MTSNTITVQVDENGEHFLEFPEALINQVGWDVGDTLIWEELPDGSYSVRKAESE